MYDKYEKYKEIDNDLDEMIKALRAEVNDIR